MIYLSPFQLGCFMTLRAYREHPSRFTWSQTKPSQGSLALRTLKGFSSSPCPTCFLSLRAVGSVHRGEQQSECGAQRDTHFLCDVHIALGHSVVLSHVLLTSTLKRHALSVVPFCSDCMSQQGLLTAVTAIKDPLDGATQAGTC